MPRKRRGERTYLTAYASARLMGALDPSEITRRLRLPPDHAHRAGDLRIDRGKNGEVFEYSPYDSSLWCMSSEAWVDSPRLQVHLEWLLQELEPRAQELAKILSGAVTADFFCFSSGQTPDPPSLPRELVQRCETLGFPVAIDHYED